MHFCSKPQASSEKKIHAWALLSGKLPLQVQLKCISGKDLSGLWLKYAKPLLSHLSTVSLRGIIAIWDDNDTSHYDTILKDLQSPTPLTCLSLYDFEFPDETSIIGQPLHLTSSTLLVCNILQPISSINRTCTSKTTYKMVGCIWKSALELGERSGAYDQFTQYKPG